MGDQEAEWFMLKSGYSNGEIKASKYGAEPLLRYLIPVDKTVAP